MKKMEKLLSEIQTPKVKVDAFRRNLRRSLLDSGYYRKSRGVNYHAAFYLSTAIAAILAVVSALFVYQPDLPARVHYALISDRADVGQESARPLLIADNSTAHDINEMDIMGELSLPMITDFDEEFVRYAAQREYNLNKVDLHPVEQDEFYAIRQFRLDNGQRVFVYTQIPDMRHLFQDSY